ncbi:MAG: hypothetical protein OXU71_08025 [Gammaproteobacteria bacterium]|nr:hypothetical protein [Gammaproteobacteria bacterium]
MTIGETAGVTVRAVVAGKIGFSREMKGLEQGRSKQLRCATVTVIRGFTGLPLTVTP